MKIEREWLLSEAQALGFEQMAVCRAQDVSSLYDVWRQDTGEGGAFSFLSGMPTNPELSSAASVLLLSRPFHLYKKYPETCARVSGYYFAAHEAHRSAELLAASIREHGAEALLSKLPLKPLAQAMGFGQYAANTVVVRDGAHQLFQAVVIDAAIDSTEPFALPSASAKEVDCGRFCPSQALHDGRLDITLCLRNHMLRDEIMPEPLRKKMGTRLLGCDSCLEPFPHCAYAPLPEWYPDLFSFDLLLNPEKLHENKNRLADKIGANYARPLRILAQAALIAGNAAGAERYAPLLSALCGHENPVVAEHAKWSLRRI